MATEKADYHVRIGDEKLGTVGIILLEGTIACDQTPC